MKCRALCAAVIGVNAEPAAAPYPGAGAERLSVYRVARLSRLMVIAAVATAVIFIGDGISIRHCRACRTDIPVLNSQRICRCQQGCTPLN